MASLRDVWPSLSPRERDALCGRALGITPRRMWVACVPGEEYINGSWFNWNEKAAAEAWLVDLQRDGLAPEPATVHEGEDFPPLSSTWEGAGRLIDELEVDGWEWQVRHFTGVRPPDAVVWRYERNVFVACEGDSGPSAVALAFCLARGVTAPEKEEPAR